MNKNYLLAAGAAIVLLVLGGAWAMSNQQPVTPPEVVSQPVVTNESVTVTETVVERTADGFSPAIVTVKKGQTVKFVNKESTQMSVASDPHPTHTNYPEFDQYKSPEKGKAEFSFVFDKVGTWGYHNHFNSSQTGTVVVTE